MTEQSGAVSPYTNGGTVVSPSAVSSAKSAAVFNLGEMLKTVVHKMPSLHTEAEVDNAVNVIDAFVRAFVPNSEMVALRTGEERAAKEDVSLRVPPGGVPTVVSGPVLDYAKLAQAILAEQRKLQEVESGQ